MCVDTDEAHVIIIMIIINFDINSRVSVTWHFTVYSLNNNLLPFAVCDEYHPYFFTAVVVFRYNVNNFMYVCCLVSLYSSIY